MASFDLEVKYKTRGKNTNGAALSRFPTAPGPLGKLANGETGVAAFFMEVTGTDNTFGNLWEAALRSELDI